MVKPDASSARNPTLSIALISCPGHRQLAALSLAGELDRSNEEDARQAIERCLNQGARCLVIDLGGLTFMDSSGINLLVRTYNALLQRHGRLALVAPPGPIRRVLDMVQLPPRVPVYPSLQHALADLGAPAAPPSTPHGTSSMTLAG